MSAYSKELTIVAAGFFMLIVLVPVLFFSNYHLMAFSANTTLAGGFGFGSVICPNKLVFNNEQIQFQANKSKSAHTIGNSSFVSGFWTIGTLSIPHTVHLTFGPIKELHLASSLHKMVVKGIQQQDNICKSGNNSASGILKSNYINITGQCNTRSRILVSSVDGIKGTFNGTMVCIAFR